MDKRCDGSIENGNGDHGPDCEDGSDEDIKVCCSGDYTAYDETFCSSFIKCDYNNTEGFRTFMQKFLFILIRNFLRI